MVVGLLGPIVCRLHNNNNINNNHRHHHSHRSNPRGNKGQISNPDLHTIPHMGKTIRDTEMVGKGCQMGHILPRVTTPVNRHHETQPYTPHTHDHSQPCLGFSLKRNRHCNRFIHRVPFQQITRVDNINLDQYNNNITNLPCHHHNHNRNHSNHPNPNLNDNHHHRHKDLSLTQIIHLGPHHRVRFEGDYNQS